MRNTIPRDRFGSAIVLIGVVASAVLVALAIRSDAAAAKGVFFDPDTPAGKEYALPLAQARNEATGGAQTPGASAPLFGVGIPTRDEAPSRSAAVPQGGEAGRRARNEETSGLREAAAGERTADIRLASAGGGYPATTGVGIVLAIVLLGAGLGLAFRGLQRLG